MNQQGKEKGLSSAMRIIDVVLPGHSSAGFLKAKCSDCGGVFEIPYGDRVDAILFGHWDKYHICAEEGRQ